MSANGEVGSFFAHLELLPPDAGLEELPLEFSRDSFEGKVSLGAGVYRDDEGRPWTLPVVQKVLPCSVGAYDAGETTCK